MARKLTKEEALQQFNEMERLVETSPPIKLSNILLGFLGFGLVVIALGALPSIAGPNFKKKK